MDFVKYYVMQAKAGAAADLQRSLKALRASISKLPGSLGVELLQDMDRPESFHFIERWDSKASQGTAGKLLSPEVMSAMKLALGAAPVGLNLRPPPTAE